MIRLGQLVGAGVGGRGLGGGKGPGAVVRARSIRIDVGRMSPEIVESGKLSEFFAIYARVARKLAPGSAVTAEEMEQGHPPVAVFEQYIKGLLASAPVSKVAFLSQALRIEPSFHRSRIELWNAYTDLSEHQQALAAVRVVPAAHRLARQARFLGAISMLQLSQYEQAIAVLEDLNQARPDPAILNNIGIAQLRRPPGQAPNTAASFFRQATQADNADSDLFFNLGYAYWLQKDLPNAVDGCVRRFAATRLTTRRITSWVWRCRRAAAPPRPRREKELARRLSSDYAEWDAKQAGRNEVPRADSNASRPTSTSPRPSASRTSSSRRSSAISATWRRFHLEAGRRAFQAERDGEAIAALRRAVYLAPYDSAAHMLLGRAYLRSGRMEEAVDEFKIAIWSDDTVAAHLALADAYVQGRDYAAARSELQWILKADPQSAEAKRMLDRLPP